MEEFRESRPTPDPTILTMSPLTRAVEDLKELMEIRFECTNALMERLRKELDAIPAMLDHRFGLLRELSTERLVAIQNQFSERDLRASQSIVETRAAVDLAFQSAKDTFTEQNRSASMAVAKAELATAKQIESLAVVLQNTSAVFDSKINDIKERLTLYEGRLTGSKDNRAESNSALGFIIAAAGVLIGVGGLIIATITYLGRHT